jgi:addiction module HigA family antidote
MIKNGMRPAHPGKVLLEDFLIPGAMSAHALAKALNVPAARINDVLRGRRGVSADTAMRLACALLRWRCALVAEFAGRIRPARWRHQNCEAHRPGDRSGTMN